MSNPNPQLSVTDMNRFMNMTQADLQAEANAQAAITAQLKTDEAAMLQDRMDLRARLTTPPAPDDAEVRNNIQRITGNIADGEREIAYSEAVEKLLSRLLPATTTSSTPMTSSTPTTATTSPTTGTTTGSTTSTTTTTTSTMQYRQILGKIPEYKLADDFDIFLSRFETNLKPFQRLGDNDLQCDTTALSSSPWQSPWSATTRIVAQPRWETKKQKSVLPIKVSNLGLQIWNSKI